jgi:hypothetical protein
MTIPNEEKFEAFAQHHHRHCGPRTAMLTCAGDELTLHCTVCQASFGLSFLAHQAGCHEVYHVLTEMAHRIPARGDQA